MALPFDDKTAASDPRAVNILAKTMFRELRASGYGLPQIMALAGELLALVTQEMRNRSS